jgi:acyl-CoA reductase-like NAD-dependent aldehyde dehydrogenase
MELRQRRQKIQVGDPFNQNTFQGPQVSQTQYDRIMNYIECGKQEGAQVITGGARSGKNGFFIEPTIFAGGKKGMKIVEEIFGPVIVAAVFDTEEEVIKLANDNVYGLPPVSSPRTSPRATVSPTSSTPVPSGSTASTSSTRRFPSVAQAVGSRP